MKMSDYIRWSEIKLYNTRKYQFIKRNTKVRLVAIEMSSRLLKMNILV